MQVCLECNVASPYLDMDLKVDNMDAQSQALWTMATDEARIELDCYRAMTLKSVMRYVADHSSICIDGDRDVDHPLHSRAKHWLAGEASALWTSSSASKSSLHLSLRPGEFALRDFTSDRLFQHCLSLVVAKLVTGQATDSAAALVGVTAKDCLLLWDSKKAECIVDQAPPSRSHASQIRLATFSKQPSTAGQARFKTRVDLDAFDEALPTWPEQAAQTARGQKAAPADPEQVTDSCVSASRVMLTSVHVGWCGAVVVCLCLPSACGNCRDLGPCSVATTAAYGWSTSWKLTSRLWGWAGCPGMRWPGQSQEERATLVLPPRRRGNDLRHKSCGHAIWGATVQITPRLSIVSLASRWQLLMAW